MKVREVISRIPNELILLLQNLKTFANDMAYLCVHEKLGISLVKTQKWPTKYSLLEIENAQLRSYPDM